MSVGNPIMCIECGVLHGNHQPSCERQMTGEQLWKLFDRFVTEWVSRFPPRERHKYTGKLLGAAETVFPARYGSRVWEEFRDARFRAGYHR